MISLPYPLQLPNTFLYLDSRNPLGNLILPSNNTNNAWSDLTSNIVLANGTPANQGAYQNNVINGLPTIRFNGTNQMYSAPGLNNLSGSASISAFFVVNPSSTGGWLMDSDASKRLVFELNGYTGTYFSSNFTPLLGWQILTYILNSSSNVGTVYVNGVSAATGTYGGVQLASSVAICSDFTGTTEFFTGDMLCAGLISGAISTNQHTALLTYLSNYSGIAL